MKKLLITVLTLVTGCSTYQVQLSPDSLPGPVEQIITDPNAYALDTADELFGGMFTQPINDPFIFANQANQLISGVAGPNNVSGDILKGQNYYRDTFAILENPWQGFFIIRNLWVK